MNAPTDPQLLREYADRDSEAAFAELVRRHIDLVHSAAVRMVNDAHLAKDVSQGVFVALARNANKLADHPVLSGWLHLTARNIAAQTVRTEVRRRNREKEVAVMNEHPETDAAWEEIAPHLDAALGDLSEPDRDAVLLRYFENKPAQEMATILDISAEAAQKRVSRAVERLRENFAKRGVTSGAGGLAGIISANVVQAAPVGLASTVAAASLTGTAVSASAATITSKTLAMTTIQKALIAVMITAAAGLGIYEMRRASQLRQQVQILERSHGRLTTEIRRLQQAVREANNSGTEVATRSKDRSSAGSGNQTHSDTNENEAPTTRYISEDGNLSSALIAKYGLTRDQFMELQGVVSSHWKQMATWAARSIFRDEAASNAAQDGANIYRLPAMDQQERKASWDKFSQDLRSASNGAAADAIVAGLSNNHAFADMGSYDVVFRFTQMTVTHLDLKTDKPIGQPRVIPNAASVHYSYVNPKSGEEEMSSGGNDLDDVNELFGNIFQPEE